jgi:hypothetical protein
VSTITRPGGIPRARWKRLSVFQITASASGLNDNQEETTMTKLSFFSVAAVAAFAALTVPAFAQQKPDPAIKVSSERHVCANRSQGNPYSREADYWDWSSWQQQGGWDARNSFKCVTR